MKREDALPRPQAKKSAGPNTEAKSQAPVVNSDEEQTPLEAISTDEAAQDVVPETTDQISGGSAIKQAESPIEKEDTSQVSKDGVSVTSETSMNTETVDAPTAIENGVEPTARTISDEQSSEVTAVPAETEPVHQAVELPKATAEEPASAGDPEELSREELWEKLLRVD
jgi:hypothetical protein